MATPTSLPAVRVDAVSKDFALPHEHVHTLKERALHPFRRRGGETLHALRDVSFDVAPGEFFGIVGRNGSGKSTLLKCLAAIYAVDAGAIYVNGRLSTFIELGVGFNPDLPARDNVMLNATMLGLSPREAARRFDEVIAFAELEDFVDLKLKNYSSGMEVRLAFSVMIQVDADILLIDEVLAVGDAAFQQKCFDEFARIREQGRTVLLVTHDMGAVQRFCDRAMLLESGEIVELGDPERVGNRYLDLNFSDRGRPVARARSGRGALRATGAPTIEEAWFEDADGRRADVLPAGERCAFVARVVFHERVENPLFGVNLQNSRRDTVLSASNLWSDPELGRVRSPAKRCASASASSTTSPPIATTRRLRWRAAAASGVAWIDRREHFAPVLVTGVRRTDALVDLPYELALQR